MNTLSANDLKTKGISAVEELLRNDGEVVITVRGKGRYVVMDLAKYEKLREYELEIALQEAKADMEVGRYVIESAAEHVKRIS